jgi:hypothetical protein
VRELTRVAVTETEREWLEAARGKSVRQLEELVVGKCSGDHPSSPHQPAARRHVLRFEVAPETFSLFREALAALQRSTSSSLDDDAALLAMARHVLEGPRDDGRASYQIALSVCAECGRGRQSASGEFVPVGTEIIAMAKCDGQHLGGVTPRWANDGSPLGGALANDNAYVDANAQTTTPAVCPTGCTPSRFRAECFPTTPAFLCPALCGGRFSASKSCRGRFGLSAPRRTWTMPVLAFRETSTAT